MSDWWTQPSTPARASVFASPARASTSRARFVADDPDPSADAPKFLPSFVGSPAGKLALVRSLWWRWKLTAGHVPRECFEPARAQAQPDRALLR
jgi:hypothetical protein